ncbi:class E sortase [Nocardioides sp. W7]|uniref:sortase n=1 Tax=Nocardioides sp. W7 TaxID=2931390 RepID=UPI001FD3AE1A|nr:class E sortase [Nocardioides sp. W7]
MSEATADVAEQGQRGRLPQRPGRTKRARPARPPRAPHPHDNALAAASSAFTMLGLVACWIVLQMLVLGGLSQARDQSLLYGDFREQLAAATAPVGDTPIEPGVPVALMEIAGLDLEQVVIEGTASGDLLVGPGHLRGTVLPGQEGTSVVMGRAASYGGPFGDISTLKAGDPITVTSAQGVKTFTVLGVRRTGDPLPQPRPVGTARLTLISAEGEGEGSLSALRPGEVVYIDAEAPEAFPAPPAAAVTVPESERPMADDSANAMPLLVLWMALLLALTLAVVAARQRWSALLVWVVATPVAIALAWQATDVVMRLLPNLV